MAKEPKIVICVKGGVVSYIASAQIVECVVVDYDTDGDLEATLIPESEDYRGNLARAYIGTEQAALDPDWVDQIFKLLGKEE